MLKLNVLNMNGQNVGEIELAESIFNVEVNEHVLYEVVKNQLANKIYRLALNKQPLFSLTFLYYQIHPEP